jgi:hypothetical protein
MKSMRKFISVVLIAFLFGAVVPAAYSAPGKQSAKPPQDFTACVDREKSGAVVILMDESKSVYESDPTNNRLQGVQIFIDELSDLAKYRQAKVQVKLSGMGAAYVSRSGGWQTLEKDSAGVVSSLKQNADSTWNGKSGTGYSNKEGTDIWGALDGVKQDFNSLATVNCKLLVFFKDGADWQYYARDGKAVKLPEAQDLREQGKFHEADELGAADICRGLGVADSLRSSDIYLVAAGLQNKATDNFEKLQALAEGYGDGYRCGDEVAKGSFFRVESAASLQQDFAAALEGQIDVAAGNRTFRLSPGLTSIRIVSSGLTSSYQVVPPTACNGSGETKIGVDSAATGSFGQAVNWTRTNYGQTGSNLPASLRVVISHDIKSTDYSCWSGAWKVKATPETLTSLKFDANLKAVIKFAENATNPVLFPGKSQKFSVVLQRIDDSSVDLKPEDVNSDLDYYAEASLFQPNGDVIDTLFDSGEYVGGRLPKSGFYNSTQTLSIGDKYATGQYKIRITLYVKVLDSNIDLIPVQTESPIIVGSPIKAPEVLGLVQLGTISGSSATTGKIQVRGSDRDTCILFNQGLVKLTAAPDQVSYGISGECAKVPAGQTVELSFQISPKPGSKLNAVGSVDGYLLLKAQVIDSASTVVDLLPAKFSGRQDAAPNEEARWLFVIGFMILSGLVSYLMLYLLSRAVAKFPPQKAANQLQSLGITVRVGRYDVSPVSGSFESAVADLDRPQWVQVDKGRRSALVNGQELLAKSSGLRLAAAGYAVVQGEQIGVGGPAVSGGPSGTANPVIGLGLQRSWFLLIPRSEVEGKSADDSFSAIGELVVIFPATSNESDRLALIRTAESTISQKIESIVKSSTQRAVTQKEKPAKTEKVKEKKKKDKDGSGEGKPEIPDFRPEEPKDPFAF